MSGTSLDGIDVAIVNFSEHAGMQLCAAETYPFDQKLRQDLLKLINTGTCQLQHFGQIDVALGYAYAEAINQLITETHTSAQDIIAIGCHGQTIFHAPKADHPFSMQIGNANVIAELTGITTVSDFRQRDMVLGGQGAPLVPAFHHAMFHHVEENRVIINIGGISNITILPKEQSKAVLGFDTGPGNVLMDQWFQQHHSALYDENGQWARGGEIDEELKTLLLSDAYFGENLPKSTGREHFNLDWLNENLLKLDRHIKASDIQHTLLDVTVTSLVDAIQQHAPDTDSVFVCGGGAHNGQLMQLLREKIAPVQTFTTDALNLAPDWVEACAFAWLAKQTLAGLPGNLPAVTGAKKATILGAIYSSNEAS